ncbi:hypothetical protein B9479_006643 [Cryptococcus floricola]|uniref:SWIM-type domain-containing protein n=1 Tax=Cryptococcus floricola TaxID=2591691 RepID=A0A5D3AMM6_9TREE|nr:hypothetical protein B9479_006643 [Cryptococcus floricola]
MDLPFLFANKPKKARRGGNNSQNLVQNNPNYQKRNDRRPPPRNYDVPRLTNPNVSTGDTEPDSDLPPPQKRTKSTFAPPVRAWLDGAFSTPVHDDDDDQAAGADGLMRDWQMYRWLIRSGDVFIIEMWKGVWLMHDWDEKKLAPKPSSFCHLSAVNGRITCDCSSARQRLSRKQKGKEPLGTDDQHEVCTHCDLYSFCNDLFPDTITPLQLQPVTQLALLGISTFPLLFSIQQTGTTPDSYHNSGGRVVTMFTGSHKWDCDCSKHGKSSMRDGRCPHIEQAIRSAAERELISMNETGEFSLTPKVEIIPFDGPEKKEAFINNSTTRQDIISHRRISAPPPLRREDDPIPFFESVNPVPLPNDSQEASALSGPHPFPRPGQPVSSDAPVINNPLHPAAANQQPLRRSSVSTEAHASSARRSSRSVTPQSTAAAFIHSIDPSLLSPLGSPIADVSELNQEDVEMQLIGQGDNVEVGTEEGQDGSHEQGQGEGGETADETQDAGNQVGVRAGKSSKERVMEAYGFGKDGSIVRYTKLTTAGKLIMMNAGAMTLDKTVLEWNDEEFTPTVDLDHYKRRKMQLFKNGVNLILKSGADLMIHLWHRKVWSDANKDRTWGFTTTYMSNALIDTELPIPMSYFDPTLRLTVASFILALRRYQLSQSKVPHDHPSWEQATVKPEQLTEITSSDLASASKLFLDIAATAWQKLEGSKNAGLFNSALNAKERAEKDLVEKTRELNEQASNLRQGIKSLHQEGKSVDQIAPMFNLTKEKVKEMLLLEGVHVI